MAADEDVDIDMWVRARPENGQVTLTVVDWKEREAEPDPPMEPVEQERQADLVRAAEGWNWRVDNDLRFLAMPRTGPRSEEHTSELQSLMRNSYAVFCLKKKTK